MNERTVYRPDVDGLRAVAVSAGVTSWDYGHLTTRAATYMAQRLPL